MRGQNVFIFTISLLLWSAALHGQSTNNVSGVVLDSETGEGLPGATVMVSGTGGGTVTDLDGEFALKASADDELSVSFIGYQTQVIPINNKTNITVQLALEISALNEVIIVGYGTLNKRDVTGSVAKIDSKDITEMKVANFAEGLQGKAAGLQISTSSGVPGSAPTVRVRGVNSVNAGKEPLWVIDGMPIFNDTDVATAGNSSSNRTTSQSPLSLINPNDIASIEVLKDASATAIYGSRGTNGVILVTTKSAKSGKGSISVNISGGISTLVKDSEDVGFASTEEWFDLVEQGKENTLGANNRLFIPDPVIGVFKDNPPRQLSNQEARNINTNWFDEILSLGSFQQVSVSAMQGTDKIKAYLSADYREDNSVLNNNSFRRLTAKANIDYTPLENLSIGTKLTFSNSLNNRVTTGSGSNGGGFLQANREAKTWFPIYDPTHPSGYWNPRSRRNLTAVQDQDLIKNVLEQFRYIGNFNVKYNVPFIEGLSIRPEVSFDVIQSNSIYWVNELIRNQDNDGTSAEDVSNTFVGINYNAVLSYVRTFGKHYFNIVAGTESLTNRSTRRFIEGTNLIGSYQELGSPNAPAGNIRTAYAFLDNELYLQSYFSRINYTLNDRYIFSLSARTDGSSKFLKDNRWSFFPALGIGWIVSEEDFFGSLGNTFSLFKLRGSVGITGNQSINPNDFITTYRNEVENRYGDPSLVGGGTTVQKLGNPAITWETSENYDVGIDFGVFKDRITGYAAYYLKNVSELLLNRELPISTGTVKTEIRENIGTMRNYGLEFDISAVAIAKANFKWKVNFNITTNDNKLVSLATPQGLVNRGGRNQSRANNRLNTYYMGWDAGVDSERGVNTIWELDQEHFKSTGETRKTGRKIPATSLNLENNRFYHDDKTSLPRVYGGIGNNFSYKNFDLTISVTYETGRYLYDYTLQRSTEVQTGQAVLRSDLIGNTWTPENPNAKYPELAWNSQYRWNWDPELVVPGEETLGGWVELPEGQFVSYDNSSNNWSKYLFKADFLRLRLIQIGYTFPSKWLDNLKISSARAYISGSNLLTYAPFYDGWDPETMDSNSAEVNLPPLKTYTVGLNVKF